MYFLGQLWENFGLITISKEIYKVNSHSCLLGFVDLIFVCLAGMSTHSFLSLGQWDYCLTFQH